MDEIILDENTPTGQWRAVVRGGCYGLSEEWARYAQLAVITADFLQIPDEMPLMPVFSAASRTPTQLDDPESVERTKRICHAAGRAAMN